MEYEWSGQGWFNSGCEETWFGCCEDGIEIAFSALQLIIAMGEQDNGACGFLGLMVWP